jgi:hypothetical protein
MGSSERLDFLHKPQDSQDANLLNHEDTETLRKDKAKIP